MEAKSINFVNTKSKERVKDLVNVLKESFKPVETSVDETATKVVDKLVENPVYYIMDPNIKDLPKIEHNNISSKSSTASLRPFLFPVHPPTLHRDINKKKANSYYEKMRKNFLLGAREEHHRILFNFQDRLLGFIYSSDDPSLISPFQQAISRLREENSCQPLSKEKRKVAITSKFSDLMKLSVNQVHNTLENQRRRAKAISEDELYYSFKNTKDVEGIPNEKDMDPISFNFPYSFLTEGGRQLAK